MSLNEINSNNTKTLTEQTIEGTPEVCKENDDYFRMFSESY